MGITSLRAWKMVTLRAEEKMGLQSGLAGFGWSREGWNKGLKRGFWGLG